MKVAKIFIGAFILIVILNEIVKQEIMGNSREGTVKVGILVIFEIWLLDG